MSSKRFRTRYLPLVISIALCILIVGCSSKAQAPAKEDTKKSEGPAPAKSLQTYVIGTGDVGGTFYPVGATISKIVNEKVPGLRLTVESTGGSVDNARMVGTGEMMFGMCMGDIAFDAMKGKGKFQGNPAPDIRALFGVYPSVAQWITLKQSGITSITQFKGKRISVGMPGSGSEATAKIILETYGLTYDDFKPQFLGVGEGANAVRDGTLDVAFAIGGVPFGGFLDLSQTKDARLIPMEDEYVKKFLEKYPMYFKTDIPANTYKGQDTPVQTVGVKCLFIINAKAPDELAYKVTKAIWENMDIMHAGHAATKSMTKEFVASDLPVPLHPGAEKYWREQGILK